jgi:hypothetical protein
MTLSRRAAAALGVAVSAVLSAVGVFTEKEIHWLNLSVGLGLALLWAVLVFGVLVRWAERSPGRAGITGVACGVVGVLAVAAFWSGLPPVLAAAAVYLGLVSHRAGRRIGIAAIVLGGAALVLDLVAYASDVASRY